MIADSSLTKEEMGMHWLRTVTSARLNKSKLSQSEKLLNEMQGNATVNDKLRNPTKACKCQNIFSSNFLCE